MRSVIVGSLVWMLIACAHAGETNAEAAAENQRISSETTRMTTEPAELRRLSDSEIRRLLEGRTLSYVTEPGVLVVTSQHRETFSADGSVLVALDRASKRGRYRIVDDQLCVILEPNSREECSLLFVSTDGSYYISPVGSQYVQQRPVRIIIE